MALRLSTGLRNFILAGGSLKDAMQGGEIQIYNGTQPGSADSAPTGTLLATITDGSGARTAEVLATATITLDSGAAGSIDSVTVDGNEIIDNPVVFNTSLAQTATDLAKEINSALSSPEFFASASGTTVTLTGARKSGASLNGLAVAGANTTIATSYTAFAGGVDSVNGLRMGVAAGGTLTKDSAQDWTGVGAANGTAGWFRYVGSVADAGGNDALEEVIRIDGNIATSGAQLNLPSTAIAVAAVQTVSSLQISMPGS